ncbi:MAG: ComF family protein [Isosphaeraceae bacterium]|nr:ComF family protein [Isosphaeraceae bacterium]
MEGSAGLLCRECRAELIEAAGAACPRCALLVGPWTSVAGGCPECRGRRLGFDGAIALGPYQGPLRDLCLRLKRGPNAWMAPWLADLLLEVRGEALRASGADRIAPVPLHWWRQLRRGYNQAEALAHALGRRLGLPVVRALRRVKPTRKLAGLGRVERAEALREAFRPRSRGGPDLAGRTVLLVDDILTTGATCGAAARALKQAGAARVVVAVLGRAEGRA